LNNLPTFTASSVLKFEFPSIFLPSLFEKLPFLSSLNFYHLILSVFPHLRTLAFYHSFKLGHQPIVHIP